LIFGGYVGTVGEFGRAADAWQDCLDESPAITYFHHKEAPSECKIIPLARVVSGFDLQGFVVTIPHTPFLDRHSAAAKGMFGTRIYDWGFVHTVTGVLEWVDQNFPEGEKVDFVFGTGRRELDLCRAKLFDPLSSEGNGIWRRAGTCTPGDSKTIQALQMGDLLAGQVLEHIRTGEAPGLAELAHSKPILLLRENPPSALGVGLTLQKLGKQLYDAGRQKFLNCPGDSVPLKVFTPYYEGMLALAAMMEVVCKELVKDEDPTE
jgi:hypothetical protein